MKSFISKIFFVMPILISPPIFAESFESLTERGYSLILNSPIGNGNTWMFLLNKKDMYVCLNRPGVNRIDDCKYITSQGNTSYLDLLENNGRIIADSAVVGNSNVWLTFLNGSKTRTCLAMPGISTIECK